MELFRVHAYSVWPLRTVEEGRGPEGGAVRVSAELSELLEQNREAAAFDTKSRVDFNIDPTTRTSDVREDVMTFGFGEPPSAKAAALDLAQRLGMSMDRRTSPALFIPTAYRKNDQRRVILWVFPSEDALRFHRTEDGAAIEILRQVFNQRLQLRKAALFEGGRVRTAFLFGRALDFQASQTAREVADFWITRFLNCRLSIEGASGSRMLAKMIKNTHDRLDDPEDRDQVHAAAIAIRRSPHPRISAASFAERYLSGRARDEFLASGASQESSASLFDFDRDAFDAVLHFRVFRLEDGVYVSAPPNRVGHSVKIEGQAQRRLVCEGNIVDERLRSSHV
jgi:hypothetical protein